MRGAQENDNHYTKYISNGIWMIFDGLRGAIPIEDYNIILLLLSGFKDNVLDKYNKNDAFDIQNFVIKSFAQDIRYSKVIKIYAPIIKFIPSEKLIEVVQLIHYFKDPVLLEKFPQIFDNLVYKLSEAQGKYTGEYIQPYEITRFIMNLAKLRDNDTIYNPFA